VRSNNKNKRTIAANKHTNQSMPDDVKYETVEEAANGGE